MKIVDIGVLENSFMDFLDPTPFAQKALYYITQFGHFYCNERYFIKRNYLDLFLLVYVVDGTLEVRASDMEVSVSKNQIAIVDCRSPHQYFSSDHCEFLWFHYNGSSSAAYLESLLEQYGIVFSGDHIQPLKQFQVHPFCSPSDFPQ